MANDGLPQNTVAPPTGLITKMFDWFWHPYYAPTDTWNWAAFVLLVFFVAYLWSKVVKQTLDAVL